MEKNPHPFQGLLRSSLLFAFFSVLAIYGGSEGQGEHGGKDRHRDIGDLVREGQLRVLTRNAPTTWYEGREGFEGPEHDLVHAFARDHGLEVIFEFKNSLAEILEAMRTGNAHLAAAGISRTREREAQGLVFGPTYQTIRQHVVCRRGGARIPRKPGDLVGLHLAVIEGGGHEETLQALRKKWKKLRWDSLQDVGAEQLLERVWKKRIDCTLADANIVRINRRYYPELIVPFSISEKRDLAWVLAPEWAPLSDDLARWLARIKAGGELAIIHDRYYGFSDIFDYVDLRIFIRRIHSRLPQYQAAFRRAAVREGLPWTLLAAQGYQESHWDPRSKSPTGVRGIMMLTRETARSLRVSDRLDPLESISGGAKYLRKILNRIPKAVPREDRIWFALAAYNIGYEHLKDARLLARRLGKNPNRWFAIKSVLPLLSQEKYYKSLPHGYARGTEPVRYVKRIRDYHQILKQQFQEPPMAKRPTPAPNARKSPTQEAG